MGAKKSEQDHHAVLKNTNQKVVLWGIIVVLLFAGAGVVFFWNPSVGGGLTAETPTIEPTQAPVWDFDIEDLAGNPVRLSELRGKVVLVNFWASWCPPCREEMPLLQDFYLSHEEEGFVLLGVNVSEDADDVLRFAEENNYQFPIWRDPPGNLLIEVRMSGLPASILVDQDGRIVKRWIGPLVQEDLVNVILPLLD